MSFTDGKPRVATEDEVHKFKWGGTKVGERFRCGICGHRFRVGDYWRWVYDNDKDSSGYGNFSTCQACDGPDVREKRRALVEEWKGVVREKFWWAIPDESP